MSILRPPGSSGDEGSDGDDVDVDSDDDKSDSKEKGGGEDSSEEDSDKDTKKEKSTGKKAKMVTFSENKKGKMLNIPGHLLKFKLTPTYSENKGE